VVLQVQFDADKQVVYVIAGQELRVLDAKPVINAALAGTAAIAPNMPLLYSMDLSVDIQDVAYCSSKKGSFVAICTSGTGGKTSPGSVFVYDTKNARNRLTLVASATVGALPDQLTFMKEGDKCAKILTANGEPRGWGGISSGSGALNQGQRGTAWQEDEGVRGAVTHAHHSVCMLVRPAAAP
jgi:hypothetical protein